MDFYLTSKELFEDHIADTAAHGLDGLRGAVEAHIADAAVHGGGSLAETLAAHVADGTAHGVGTVQAALSAHSADTAAHGVGTVQAALSTHAADEAAHGLGSLRSTVEACVADAAAAVKTVNNTAPDSSGNVAVTVPTPTLASLGIPNAAQVVTGQFTGSNSNSGRATVTFSVLPTLIIARNTATSSSTTIPIRTVFCYPKVPVTTYYDKGSDGCTGGAGYISVSGNTVTIYTGAYTFNYVAIY